jgi:hypothetical protein
MSVRIEYEETFVRCEPPKMLLTRAFSKGARRRAAAPPPEKSLALFALSAHYLDASPWARFSILKNAKEKLDV